MVGRGEPREGPTTGSFNACDAIQSVFAMSPPGLKLASVNPDGGVLSAGQDKAPDLKVYGKQRLIGHQSPHRALHGPRRFAIDYCSSMVCAFNQSSFRRSERNDLATCRCWFRCGPMGIICAIQRASRLSDRSSSRVNGRSTGKGGIVGGTESTLISKPRTRRL